MISFGVIMLAEVCQGAAQREFTEQNELGKTFAFARASPPLRVTIQIWAACRQSHTAYPAGRESIAEVRAELLVAIVQHFSGTLSNSPYPPASRYEPPVASSPRPDVW